MKNSRRFVRTQEVCDYLSISKTTLWRLINSGKFPKPIKINSMSFWDLNAIEKFMNPKEEVKND